MTGADEPPPPGVARPRLPVSPSAGPGAPLARVAVLGIYATSLVLFLAMAGYMLVARKAALTEPRVFVPLLGAVWFAVRLAMLARAKRP